MGGEREVHVSRRTFLELMAATTTIPLVASASSAVSARGGHLFEATVRPTVELVLTTYPKPILRKPDPETGLPLLAP
jgi:hypothetical protein